MLFLSFPQEFLRKNCLFPKEMFCFMLYNMLLYAIILFFEASCCHLPNVFRTLGIVVDFLRTILDVIHVELGRFRIKHGLHFQVVCLVGV